MPYIYLSTKGRPLVAHIGLPKPHQKASRTTDSLTITYDRIIVKKDLSSQPASQPILKFKYNFGELVSRRESEKQKTPADNG
jgi:hypothetical protein